MKSWRILRNEGEALLSKAGIENAYFDAYCLAEYVSGMTKTELLLADNMPVSEDVVERFYNVIKRRLNREPLQYIIGCWEFYKSSFCVGPGVLIPRPETEELVDLCVNKIKSKGYSIVYDLCAGSGCIGISIAKECPEVECFLIEYVDEALFFTRNNAKNSNLPNIKVIKCDVLNSCPENLPSPDLIVSNPPYIPTLEISSLQAEVLQEPLSALDGGADGLDFYHAISQYWLPVLSDKGFLALECAENQYNEISKLISNVINCECVTDIYGHNRFVIGEKIV